MVFLFGCDHGQGINNQATIKPEHRCSEIPMAGQPLPIVDYLFDDRDLGESISEMNVALIHEEMVKGERVSVSWVPASQP